MSLDKYNSPFSSRLRSLLEEAKISQSKLAEYVGVTRQAISSYANGDAYPTIDKFQKIAQFFNITFDYLLGTSESKKRENYDISKKLGLSDDTIFQILNLDIYATNSSSEEMKQTLNDFMGMHNFGDLINSIREFQEAYKDEPDIFNASVIMNTFVDDLTVEQKQFICKHRISVLSPQQYTKLCLEEAIKIFTQMLMDLVSLDKEEQASRLKIYQQRIHPDLFNHLLRDP